MADSGEGGAAFQRLASALDRLRGGDAGKPLHYICNDVNERRCCVCGVAAYVGVAASPSAVPCSDPREGLRVPLLQRRPPPVPQAPIAGPRARSRQLRKGASGGLRHRRRRDQLRRRSQRTTRGAVLAQAVARRVHGQV
eukprot:209979-Prymnesium_polylepis.1